MIGRQSRRTPSSPGHALDGSCISCNFPGFQNVLPLVYKSKVNDTVRATLNAVSAKLTTAGLLEMNTEMSEKKTDPETVAKDWLTKNGIISG